MAIHTAIEAGLRAHLAYGLGDREENVARWTRPRHVTGVLSAAEAAAATRLLLGPRAPYLIHVDTQAGPAPFLTYGAYWGYHQVRKESLTAPAGATTR